MKMPSQCLPLPEIYYDGAANCYWRHCSSGCWQRINETSLKSELTAQGYSPAVEAGGLLPEISATIRKIQLEHDVKYAGPLAGYPSGLHCIHGKRILVTEAPKLIRPEEGTWDTLRGFFEGLVQLPGNDQLPYLYGWIKVSYEALRDRVHRPCQALCLAGPRNCGKSFLQNLLTEILGGRSGKPHQFMSGNTAFNADLIGVEHLMIEDECASKDIRSRRSFGNSIKTVTVNETQRLHGKNKDALMVTPFWRLTVTVNDEPEDLLVLPPMDASIEDKIMLLKVKQAILPDIDTNDAWKTLKARMIAELPAFLSFLQNWRIPAELDDQRFGIRTFHHPELLAELRMMQPELRLLTMIEQQMLKKVDTWTGTAEELQAALTGKDADFAHEARSLFSYSSACGTYLGRLAHMPNPQVSRRVISGRSQWTVTKVCSETVIEDADQFLSP